MYQNPQRTIGRIGLPAGVEIKMGSIGFFNNLKRKPVSFPHPFWRMAEAADEVLCISKCTRIH
jgi:hypothetical protein